jgi:hypothetical protein
VLHGRASSEDRRTRGREEGWAGQAARAPEDGELRQCGLRRITEEGEGCDSASGPVGGAVGPVGPWAAWAV